MSDLTTVHRGSISRLSYAAIACTIGAVTCYVLASTVDDALYVVTGALGIVAFGLGVRARRDARRRSSRARLALVAIVVGGLLGTLVIAFSIGWAYTTS